MKEFFDPLLDILNEMSPYLLLGFLFAGLLHAFVPRRVYGRYLSGNNIKSVTMAALAGVPLPLCSCGVIPTAMSLRRNGASRGATVSFLISTPQTGVDSIMATWSLLGAPFALIRPLAAFVTAIFGGAMVNRFDKTSDDTPTAGGGSGDELPHGFAAKVKSALRYGFIDMMQDIGKWLIIGLVIAAVITVAMPDGFFESTRDYPLLNMAIVLVFAVPMYICATGSIPIAVALMMKGLSPGAALVLLMAGPATNMAAIMVLGKVLKARTTIIYIASIVVGAIVFGLVIDYLLPASWFVTPLTSTARHCSDCDPSLFNTVCSIILVILLCYAIFTGRHGHHHHHESERHEAVNTLKVDGMRCNHCRTSVISRVSSIDGVESVDVSIEEGTVTYAGRADSNTVAKAIEELGFSCRV